MSNIDRLYKNIPLILPKYIFSKKVKTKILKKKRWDSSVVRGAAWLWNNLSWWSGLTITPQILTTLKRTCYIL